MTSLPGSDLELVAPLAERLQHITDALAATSTVQEVIETVLAPALAALGADAGTVLLVNQPDQPLKITGRRGADGETIAVPQEIASEDHVLIADILRLREAQYFEDAGALRDAYPELERRTRDLEAIANAALPMFLDDRPFGVIVLDFAAPHHFSPKERRFLRLLSAQCAIALGRAEAISRLEAHVHERTRQLEDQTRQLEEERAAQAAFVAFTEAVGSETNLSQLVGQAITLLHETCDVEAAYFERDGDLFRASVWSPSADPALLPLLQRGFPLQHSSIARGLQQNTATFIDHWRDSGLLIPESGIYQAAAGYPYFKDETLESVLMIGSQTSAVWDERSKGIFRAVGRSLDLALDRARQTRTVTAQRDALDLRTRELAESTAELQAFSYSVSHDLRTPVRHMIGFLELARKALDGRLDERSARYLDVVEQSGRQMNTLIDGLLDLSNAAQRTLQPSLVDLNQLMARIQTTLLPDLLTRNVAWEVTDLPRVWGDQEALSQVLTQLTENALKFTQSRDPASIRIWAEDLGGAWKICVRDNGLGFDPRYQDRLFNLFQRLHRADEVSGTGVGLASVRRLILKHGGQVFAEGRPGEGATFGFTLPKGHVA